MRIRQQLLLGFMAVVALFAGAGAVSYFEIRAIERAHDVVVRASAIHELAAGYERGGREIQLGAFLYTKDNATMGRQLISEGRAAMQKGGAGLVQLVDGHGAEMLAEIQRLDALAGRALDAVVARSKGGGDSKLIDRDLNFLEARVEGMNLLLTAFAAQTGEEAAAALAAARISAERTISVTLSAVVGALVLGVLIALWVAGKIARPVRQFTEMADKVSTGQPFKVLRIDGSVEIVELGEAFQRMMNSFKIMEAMLKEEDPNAGKEEDPNAGLDHVA